MIKKHEELVEWIVSRLCYYYELGHRKGTPAMFSDQEAKRIIAAILSAFRDGRLDEELGVVGRWNPYDRKSFRIWLDELPGGETFIALRPLTGIPVECKGRTRLEKGGERSGSN